MSNKVFTKEWLRLSSSKERSQKLSEDLHGLTPEIVYLDDEKEALEVFSDILSELGLEAKTFTKFSETLDYVRANRSKIVLVISDFKMPEGDGFEFRKKIIEIAPELPFSILSALVTHEMALKGIEHKIDAFIDKPISQETMVSIIEKHAEARAQKIKEDFEILKAFVDDAEGITEQIEEICLELEDNPTDLESVSKMYGLLHTMKGSSGFFDPRILHQFAHKFEDHIKEVQTGAVTLTPEALTSWLKANDILKTLVSEFKQCSHKEYTLDELLKVFDVDSSSNVNNVKDKKTSVQAQAVHGDAAQKSKSTVSDIKVSMKLLDEFMQLSGEMTVIRNMINKAVMALEKRYSADKDVQLLTEFLGEMHKINSAVQNKITDIRRVSVKSILRPLTRTVRDTAKTLNKEVEMVVVGDELRVDNSIAEVYTRSLIHLLRNSIDHGLESTEDRIKVGKNSKGKISLTFEENDEFSLVKVSDDGAGLNIDRIKAKVIENGLRSAAEAEKMSPKDLFPMIFEAGFSTAKVTTEFSGRGVGMSMVKESVEAVGGNINIDSIRGKGSVFTLKIPVPKSVHISSCLFVEIGSMPFGVPRDCLVKVIEPSQVAKGDLNYIEGAEFLRFQDSLLPVVNFEKIIESSLEQRKREKDDIFVILKTETHCYALRVTQVYDVEDTVIKPIQSLPIKNLHLYLGGTFLADGSIGLILDVDGIANRLGIQNITLANESKNSESKAAEIQSMERFLTFELEQEGRYCLPEKEILRIEELSLASLQKSGPWHLIPYRDALLTLVDLSAVISKGKLESIDPLKAQDPISTLVIKNQDNYVGFAIKKIIDLEATGQDIEPLIKSHYGLRGHHVINGKTVTEVNLHEIMDSVLHGASPTQDKGLNEKNEESNLRAA